MKKWMLSELFKAKRLESETSWGRNVPDSVRIVARTEGHFSYQCLTLSQLTQPTLCCFMFKEVFLY